MISHACSSEDSPHSATCRTCGARATANGSRDSHDSVEGRIANAELRLAALTDRIHAAEIERAALADILARTRAATDSAPVSARAEPDDRDLAPAAGERPEPTIVAGPYRVTFGGPHGASVEALPAWVPTPSPRPILGQRPADPPDVDARPAVTQAIWDALTAETVVRVAAPPGSGATTLLALLAAQARNRGFRDGALILTEVRGPALDVAQRIARGFFADATLRHRSAADIRRDCADLHALVGLDRARLSAHDRSELGALFPRMRFVSAESGGAPGDGIVDLGPLDTERALALLEAGYGRSIDDDRERAAAATLCAAADRRPGALRLVGLAASELRLSFAELAASGVGVDEISARFIGRLLPLERRILGILIASGVPLTAESLAGATGRRSVQASLNRLLDAELVRVSGATYDAPRDLQAIVTGLRGADATVDRAVIEIAAALDPRAAIPATDRQLAAAEALVQAAFEQSEWDSVLTIGVRLAEMFALRGAFGAWGRVLNLVVSAAKRTDNPAVLDFARHELGVRSLLCGEFGKATTLLVATERARSDAGDGGGAAVTSAVLRLVLAAESETSNVEQASASPARPAEGERRFVPRRRFTLRAMFPAFTVSRRLFSVSPRRFRLSPRLFSLSPRLALGAGAAIVVAVLLVIGWGARPTKARLAIAEFSTDTAAIGDGATTNLCIKSAGAEFVEIAPDIGPVPADGNRHCVEVRPLATTTYTATASDAEGHATRRAVTVQVAGSAAPRPLKIEAFFARPARINVGDSTRLCYDVSGASLLRIVPSVGDLTRLHSCRTITLSEPHGYVYKLLAVGEDGRLATRQVRIDVHANSAPAPSATALSATTATTSRVATNSPASPPATTITAAVAAPVAATTPRAFASADNRLARRAVYQFDATPEIVDRGQAVSLCAGVGHWAHGDVTAIGTLTPGVTRCYRIHPDTTTAYRLHVTLDKSSAVETVIVTVRSPTRAHQVAHALR